MEKEKAKNKPVTEIKVIKRYQNRKLYDTQQSCYVTLEDIAKMIRNKEEVMVIDNKSKNNITAATFTQIIFESEKKACQYAPLRMLRKIIQHENGSMSSFLAGMNLFPRNQMSYTTSIHDNSYGPIHDKTPESVKESLELDKRTSRKGELNGIHPSLQNATKMMSSENKVEETTPDLPKSNYTLTTP